MIIEDLTDKLKSLGFTPMFPLPTRSMLEFRKETVSILGNYSSVSKGVMYLVNLSVDFDNARVTNLEDVLSQLNTPIENNIFSRHARDN